MKRLVSVGLLVGLLITTNGCGIHKNKRIEKAGSTERIKNDVSTSKVSIDSTKSNVAVARNVKAVSYTEDISVKRPVVEDIEISANFRMDTSTTLKGDTLKLVDIRNNNISLSIYQNGKTKELMAKVTTNAGSKITPFSEINIKRQYTTKEDKVDSLSTFENHSEIKADSLDKSERSYKKDTTTSEKIKKTLPSFWIWAIGILATVTLIYFLLKNK
ncbi:hypothetical protein [Pedobacter agri]|uniref:hypothetical protein n=1 Tax=Pedobacter agri TaxID=454586 RepID=UPI00292ECAF5|nr:hypothetical protein [Pedobacter agri]